MNGSRCRRVRDGTYSYLEGLRFETTEQFKREPRADGDGDASTRSRVNPQAPPV